MPLVSVLTAAFRPDPVHLADAYHSLCEQRVEWEWIIQVDGDSAALPDEIAADGRVSAVANGQHLRTATTRNRGLLRCSGEYVQNLDADDALVPGAIARMLEELEAHPRAAFCIPGITDWDPEAGLLRDHVLEAPTGLLEPGRLFRVYCDNRLRRGGVPYGSGGILWRRDALMAAGGWGALTGGQDTFVSMAVSCERPVVHVGAFLLYYRRHVAQTIASEEYLVALETNLRLGYERCAAIERLAGRPVPRWPGMPDPIRAKHDPRPVEWVPPSMG